jgi:hypothetical protein
VKAKEKMAEYTNSASMHDQLLRELQSREMDLQEALKAKDSQLAVLRVRMEEAERDISSRQREVESIQQDRDRCVCVTSVLQWDEIMQSQSIYSVCVCSNKDFK